LDLGLVGALLSIIVIDLVLSGDNAVVIGMAASRLPPEQRRKAIIYGGAGAVGLRIFFTALAAILLDVPLLQAIGSVLLFWIAFKLLKPVEHDAHNISAAGSLREALQTIIMADVVMSLDNILAVGGAAHGHLGLLMFGLALSIPILLFGSSLIARMIASYPILNYFGAGILVVTATRMFIHDDVVHDYLFAVDLLGEFVIAGIAVVIVLGIGYWRNQRARAKAAEAINVQSEEHRGDAPGERVVGD
jgi:YjbE family integral membrane protein